MKAFLNERLATNFGPLGLTSPIFIGSGPSTMKLDDICRAEDAGAGGVYIKSIGNHTRSDFDKSDKRQYRWIRGYGTLLTSTYLKEILPINYGIELIYKTKKICNLKVVASVFYPAMDNDEDIDIWIRLLRKMEDAGADAVQIDFFYIDLRKLTNKRIVWLITKIRVLISSVKIPVFPKLNIGMDEDLHSALALEKNILGLVYIDSIKTEPYVDIYSHGKPLFREGMLYTQERESASVVTGEPLLHYTFSLTQKIRRMTDKPLCAGGGLLNWEDVVRCLMLGASSVHMTASIMRLGFSHITKVNKSILQFMDKQGFHSVKDLIGLSYTDYDKKNSKDVFRIPEQKVINSKAKLLTEKCIHCDICERIVVCDSFKEVPYNFLEHCDGCSMCIGLCPTNALVLVEEDF